mgnify:CR=1 FL=1
MTIGSALSSGLGVAPLAGSVDRNIRDAVKKCRKEAVAPLAGSVDRNAEGLRILGGLGVAPLAGSVDRNADDSLAETESGASLPSRGAWIEIGSGRCRGRWWGCRSPRGERG